MLCFAKVMLLFEYTKPWIKNTCRKIIIDEKITRRNIKVILTPNGVQLATKRTAT